MDGNIQLTTEWQDITTLTVVNPNGTSSALSLAGGQTIRVMATGHDLSVGIYFYEGDKPSADADVEKADFLPHAEQGKLTKTALDMWVRGAIDGAILHVSGTGA